MGSSDPPYLYDRPSSRPLSRPYSQFDPKAISRASWQQSVASSRPQSAQQGPLIDFNRHPDSYMVVAPTRRDVSTLPSNTKKAVAAVRWTQFSLRVLQLFGAMGALFCGITIKPVEQTQSWIMRITPGYDMLITLYAIYHLLRSSKLRTPASTASYHVFALVMDTGLVPLYAFIAIFNNFQAARDAGPGVWSSMFPSFSETMLLVTVCFGTACAMGLLHLISMGLGLYLVVVFRKIASMPPDMNPLEDKFTSRKSSKHKHKNSELSLGSTVDEKQEMLKEEMAVPPPYRYSRDGRGQADRQVPFSHSRTQSAISFSPHNPRSAELSKQHFGEDGIYAQRGSARQSAISVAGAQSFVTANSSVTRFQDRNRSPVRQAQQDQKALLNDNWYVVQEDPAEMRLDAMNENLQPEREPQLPKIEFDEDESFVHEPLRMNPPTPSIEKQQTRKQWTVANAAPRNALAEVPINRSSTVASNNTVTSSVYSESAPSLAGSRPNSTPKKLYGDLTAAARGIRGYAKVPQAETAEIRQSPARVISRTGADVTDEPVIPEKSSRRRMFSGKRAEEGMAGFWK